MLYLIGLGVGDEKDISMRGLDSCRKADVVFAELYTAAWQGSLDSLGKTIGKNITVLEREDVEEKSSELIKEAKAADVALLVPGDPLFATTHIHMLSDAKKMKVPFTVIHSSSILTAISETGLNVYNFGKVATVVRPDKRYAPTSFYDAGVGNAKLGLHTLFLLDIDMDTKEGIEILLGIEKRLKKGLIKPGTKIIAASRLGTRNAVIRYGKASDLAKETLGPPSAVIVPGKLHFVEEEWLKNL